MINGMIKLFYSEVVKTKMKGLSNSKYELTEQAQELRNVTLKIDSLFFKLLKFLIGVVLLGMAFNINIIFGIGTLLVEIAYAIYKIKLEKQVLEAIDNIKNNIEIPEINIVSEKGKSGINGLIMLLLIGVITNFNWIIVISFVTVFLFTMKDIYSNIK
ncbi:MAG: hypothetical protein ACRDA3_03780 [Peptostreptococcaceae bacterium]